MSGTLTARLHPSLLAPIAVAVLAGAWIGGFDPLAAPQLALFTVCALAMYVIARRLPERVVMWVGAGLVLRLVLAVVIPLYYVESDEPILHARAASLSTHWLSEVGHEGFTPFVGALYSLFGTSLYVPKILNAAIGAFGVVVAYDIARHIWDERTGRAAMCTMALFPPAILYSGLFVREMPALVGLLVAIRTLIQPRLRLTYRCALALVPSFVVFLFRGPWALFPIVAILLTLLFERRVPTQLGRLMGGTPQKVVAVVLLVVAGFLLRPFVDVGIALARDRLVLGEYARELPHTQQYSGVVRLTGGDLSSPKGVAVQLLRTPFSPTPAELLCTTAEETVVTSSMAIFNYLLFPFALIGIIASRRNRKALVVVGVAVVMLGVVAASLFIGLGQRHVMPLHILLTLFVPIGFANRQRYRFVLFGWWMAAGAYMLTFLTTKGCVVSL